MEDTNLFAITLLLVLFSFGLLEDITVTTRLLLCLSKKMLDAMCIMHFFSILFSTDTEEINKLQYFTLSLLKIQVLICLKSSSEIPHKKKS